MNVLDSDQLEPSEWWLIVFKDAHVATIIVDVELLLEESEEGLRVTFVALRGNIVQANLRRMNSVQRWAVAEEP